MLFYLRLVFALLVAPVALAAQSIAINAVDPPREGQYPGSRGPNELVIYTPVYGHASTGTNPYGTEALVVDGVVEAVGGNDTAIPKDGFVVSGHGDASRWVNENLRAGVAVVHDGKELSVDTSSDAQARALLARIAAIEKALSAAPEDKELAKTIAKLRVQVEQVTTSATLERLDGLTRRVQKAENQRWFNSLKTMDSPKGEVRAVWHRLTEKTPEEIAALAESLRKAGVNVIFPETIYASQAIYKDSTGLYPKFEMFGETDALAVLIEECHKRGIEVHAWAHVFFIGIKDSAEEPALIAEKHADWLARDRQGRTASLKESNYMFLNPAHPEVRKALIAAYRALATDYDIDGFQFDYIRYCSYTDWQDDWDYSDYTRQRVREELKFDPLEITPDSHPEQWQQWRDWRESIITSFVAEASAALRETTNTLVLSADVFPELKETIAIKGQNWADWGRKGYIDSIIPMAYFTSGADVKKAVKELESELPKGMPLVVGLAPFLKLTPEQVIEQIQSAREAGADGQVMFAWDTMDARMRETLAQGPWRTFTAPSWDDRTTTGTVK